MDDIHTLNPLDPNIVFIYMYFNRNFDVFNVTIFYPHTVNGGFGLWSAWTTCSKTCGTGAQSRSRTCTNPVPNDGGQNCTGDYTQAKSCKLTSCPGKKDDFELACLDVLEYIAFVFAFFNRLREI